MEGDSTERWEGIRSGEREAAGALANAKEIEKVNAPFCSEAVRRMNRPRYVCIENELTILRPSFVTLLQSLNFDSSNGSERKNVA